MGRALYPSEAGQKAVNATEKPPPSDGLFVTRRVAGALRLIPLPLSSRTRRRSHAAKSPRGVAPPRRPFLPFSRSSPSRARTKPQMPRYAPHQRFPSAFMRNAAASPTGRDKALSLFRAVKHASRQPLMPHRIRILLAIFFSPPRRPFLTFPRSSRSPHPAGHPDSGHKKNTSNDVLFLFLRSDAALERNWAAAHRRSMGVSGGKVDRKAAESKTPAGRINIKAEPAPRQKPQSCMRSFPCRFRNARFVFNRTHPQTA